MSSTDIYNLLLSKSNKIHYIKRYLKFVNSFSNQEKLKGITEYHHILPKCKSLYPQFKSLYQNPWNGVHLTARQHFIAHWMLHKIFGDSQTRAFWLMCKSKTRINSKTYESIKSEMSKMLSELNKGNNHGKGYKYTELQKKHVGEIRRKLVKIISPNGTIYVHNGLSDFCLLYNLNYPCMRRVVLGQRSHHKGWKCSYLFDPYPEFIPCSKKQRIEISSNSNIKYVYFISPNGTIGKHKGIKHFCETYNIGITRVSARLKNGGGYLDNWYISSTEINLSQHNTFSQRFPE